VILVLVDPGADELSRQALAFARGQAEELEAILIGGEAAEAAALGAFGVARTHLLEDPALLPYAPQAWGRVVAELAARRSPSAVLGPGSDRGNEVLAHAAAILDQPMSANTVSLERGEPARVVRVRWGGSLLEEANLRGAPLILTVAAHSLAAAGADREAHAEVLSASVELAPEDLRARVSERVQARAEGVSLADAEVVVGGGRGVGSAEAFATLEQLAALLSAAVGCSRAVTMAGWRPHTDQIGQTGTKISPELYIACGISGATQHMAGCRAAKHLLAVNPDPEASILASADYAVIGDLHEVIPAVCAEIRARQGG
jgi:electron transfer flavoprotein alpha subunit